ncbi:MAG: GlsB/YeaQ/YmgE family stress response membrane protein [Candidatus Limnocylindria bacterium]
MGWIAWIAVGAVAGFLASMIVGSREGLVMMIVLGIVGGILGGFVAANVLHVGSVNGFNLESILIATLGAAAVLLVVHLATGGRGLRRS